jgi:hypothetical protein
VSNATKGKSDNRYDRTTGTGTQTARSPMPDWMMMMMIDSISLLFPGVHVLTVAVTGVHFLSVAVVFNSPSVCPSVLKGSTQSIVL